MLEWLIIGGGVHGTHLSHVLATAARVPRDRMRVLDPHPEPLACFWRNTDATGMRYLRSPAVHHLDLHPYSLRRFATRGAGKRLARFVHPYERPGLALFRAHSDSTVREHRLHELRIHTRALSLERHDRGFRVHTEQGALEARRVLLAIGMGEQPCWPAWARSVRATGLVEHVFGPRVSREGLSAAASAIVVGGGISAAQLACHLARTGVAVTLITRHAARIHRFDSDPAWLGPKAADSFAQVRDIDARRAMMTRARHRGSMPPEVHAELRRAIQRGRVRRIEAEILAAEHGPGGIALELDRDPGRIAAERLILATGFDAHRPGGELVAGAIERLGLRCAACGYPIVSPRLEWAPGLFVTGPLAELELGPIARNIAGARAAGARLLAAAA